MSIKPTGSGWREPKRVSPQSLGRRIAITFLFSSCLAAAIQPRSLELIKMELKGNLSGRSTEESKVDSASQIEGFIPFNSVQFGLRKRNQSGSSARTNEQSDEYLLRFNLKSYQELKSFSESAQLSQNLAEISSLESINQKNQMVYEDLVNSIFYRQYLRVLSDRRKQVEINFNHKADLAESNKIKLKELLDDLASLQKIEADRKVLFKRLTIEKNVIEKNETNGVDGKTLSESVEYLMGNASLLSKKLHQYLDEQNFGIKTITRKKIENDLDSLKKETSWASQEKLLDHIEFRNDFFQQDNSFRVMFNVPWFRFDKQTRIQEQTQMKVKGSVLEQERLQFQRDLKRRLDELESHVLQMESARPRYTKIKKLESKLLGVRDTAVLNSLSQVKFDMERELLDAGIGFYQSYFDILGSVLGFAQMAEKNLLEPDWMPL